MHDNECNAGVIEDRISPPDNDRIRSGKKPLPPETETLEISCDLLYVGPYDSLPKSLANSLMRCILHHDRYIALRFVVLCVGENQLDFWDLAGRPRA